jgi:O-antigen/teichoic acid export membrane protein
MLSWHVPDYEIGWYNVAYGFSGSLLFFFSGLSEAMVPSLTKSYVEDPGAVARWYHRTLRVIVAFGLPLALGATLLAEPLLRLLYGAEYAPAAQALRIIAWDAPLLMFTSFCGNLTTVTGAERAAARIYGINALANIALNAVAIPAFGIQGAAAVTVATDLIGALQFHALFSRSFAPPRLFGLSARTGLALVAMSVAVLAALSLNWHVLASVAAGAAVYLPAALALGVLDSTERALLQRAFGRLRAIAQPRSNGA